MSGYANQIGNTSNNPYIGSESSTSVSAAPIAPAAQPVDHEANKEQYIQDILNRGKCPEVPETREEYIENQIGAYKNSPEALAKLKARLSDTNIRDMADNDFFAHLWNELVRPVAANQYDSSRRAPIPQPGAGHRAQVLRDQTPKDGLPREIKPKRSVTIKKGVEYVCFKVNLNRSDTGYRTKTFTAGMYGGESKAEKAAQDYADELNREFPGSRNP